MQELLERDGLLGALHGELAKAVDGIGGIVLVQGEAGMGKTSLLQAFARAESHRADVLWGWCEALSTPRPLGPLHDMGRALDPAVAHLLDQSAPPDRLFPAVLDALQNRQKPAVLVFEDLHWADNATLDLVKFIGRRIRLLPALLVLATRSDELDAAHPLAYLLGDLPASSVTRLKLEPLSAEAVGQLMRQAGRDAGDLHRVTAGNPFFITELLASNDASGLPDSVRDAVWLRLSRLSPGERELLEMISIVPGYVETPLARALLGPQTDDLVDQLVARGLLRRDQHGDITFRHELARLATLDRLSSSLQRSLHAKVGAAMAELKVAPGADLLSRRLHHAAGAEDGRLVLELAPVAAERASRLGAHKEATSFLSTALKFVDASEPQTAAQLYENWAAEATMALLDYDTIIKAHHHSIEIWRGLQRPDRVALNLRGLSRLHWRLGQGDEARRFSDQAVDEAEKLPPGPELALAYSTRSQLNMLHYRFDDAIEWGNRAIAIAADLGAVETRIHALNNVGTSMMFDDRPGGRELMEEGLQLALEGGFHDHAARAFTNFAEGAVVAKDFDLAERLLADGIAFAARHDLDSASQYLLGRQAEFRMAQGRLRDAETIAQGVMNMERLPVVMHLPALTVLGRVRVRMGEPDGAALLRKALAEGEPTGELQRIVPVRLGLIEAAWLAGDLAPARQQLAAIAAATYRDLRPWDLGEVAVWWKRCDMDGELPGAEAAGLPLPWRLELTRDVLAAAAEWSRLGLPYEAALAAIQSSDPEAIASAIAALETMEARAAVTLAHRLAQRAGVGANLPKPRRGPSQATRQHPLGLTQSEQQVLALMADGRSNKEIARALDRSPRTIEHQVSSMLGKFSAASRMEILLRLRNEPWLLDKAV